MSANRGESLPFEAPPPSRETVGDEQEKGLEAPAAKEASPGKQAPAAQLPALPIAIPATPAVTVGLPTDDVDEPTHPASAIPDSDRIEKQWIDRAKQIVAQTRDDPFKQKHEMSKVKADYIKKRFNKVLKTDSGVS